MVICEIVSGAQWTLLIGSYLSLSTFYHLPDLGKVLKFFLVRDPIIMGYLKANIGRIQNPWSQHVEDFLVSFGLVSLLGNF